MLLLLVAGCKEKPGPDPGPKPGPDPIDPIVEVDNSGITYQLLVYSFCDSNGDGCGDFAGITSKLDYLKGLGASALWLSPIHPTPSYHGYEVLDYAGVNPDYGTEADLKNLIDKAHEKGIRIYLDYVLNHTSKDHPWFLDAKSSETSEYHDWYIFSEDPQADIKAGKIPMIERTGYNAGEWTSCATGTDGPQKIKFTLGLDSGGKPKTITAQQVDNITNTGTPTSGIYLYYGDGKIAQFYSDNTLSLEIESDWGILVRTSNKDWAVGTKYGAKEGAQKMSWGATMNLYPSTSSFDPKDILLPGMSICWYHSMFGSYMPDINYGPASSCELSAPFKAVCEAADKWIDMGVDGFRLDAIKHIYHNAGSDENPTFLKKFYDHCNARYKAAGNSGNFYMVGEHYSEASEVAPYYKGLPAFFEFSFWWRLKDAINSGVGNNFVATIQSYQKLYKQYRSDYIEATKLSNHDEDRAGNDLARNVAMMKLAGAVLLSCGGQPYIYQGEELGYWGNKSGGDEYVRTPIKWTKGGSVASAKLNGKVDNAMLTDNMSVEAQQADSKSVLKVYENFGQARAKYKALADGSLDYCADAAQVTQIAAWFRTSGAQKVLVVHNFGGSQASVSFTGAKLDKNICSNGTVTVSGSKLTLGGYSSAIFLQ